MNSHNLLSEIAGFLDLKSFIQFSQVNKQFNRVSQNVFLWEVHFYYTFFGDLSIFGEVAKTKKQTAKLSKHSFKTLCRKRGLLKTMWNDIGKEIPSPDLTNFVQEIFLTLKEPLLPIPALRRDGFCFETIFQDLVGNFENDLQSGEFEEEVPVLEDMLSEGTSSMDSCQLHELTLHRWLIKDFKKDVPNRDSTTSQSTSAESEGRHVLLELMNLFYKTVKLHCKAICFNLDPDLPSVEFLNTYCTYWEAYTSAIHRMQTLMAPINHMVNRMSEKIGRFAIRTPFYSVLRVMAICWQRTVIRSYGPDLVKSVAQVVNECRMKFPSPMQQDDLILIKKAIDSITDISINELSIHFVKHSEFDLTGLLSQLSSALLQNTQSFYSSLKSNPIPEVLSTLDQDLDLLTYTCIPSILNPLKSQNLQLRLNIISTYLLSLFDSFPQFLNENPSIPSIITSSFLQSSDFSKFLFKSRPSISIKSKIQQFLCYVQDNNEIHLVHSYNSAQEELDSMPGSLDAEIEYKTQKISKPSLIENKLFSFDSDLDYDEFLTISANFSIM